MAKIVEIPTPFILQRNAKQSQTSSESVGRWREKQVERRVAGVEKTKKTMQ
jgi:hypothetical protein